MANPQQFDRLCHIVALLVRRLLETDCGADAPGRSAAASPDSSSGKAAYVPKDARESPPCQVGGISYHSSQEEVAE